MGGLVEQLGGDLSFSDNRPGVRATIKMPLHDTGHAGVPALT
jgi:hypothetical protein